MEVLKRDYEFSSSFSVFFVFSYFLVRRDGFTGKEVFEWDQTIEEVNLYIPLPPGVPKNLFYCKIQSSHMEVGIKGNPPYLNV